MQIQPLFHSATHVRHAAAPPAPRTEQEVRDSLPVLSRACLATGDGLARLGGGGCALIGALAGAAAMPLMPSVGLPVVGAILGYLSGWDASGARDAWQGGPTSQAWQQRDRATMGPPRAKTTADAGSHLLTVGTFLAATGLGAAAFGAGPGALMGAVGITMVAAVALGRAGGHAERAMLDARYPGQG